MTLLAVILVAGYGLFHQGDDRALPGTDRTLDNSVKSKAIAHGQHAAADRMKKAEAQTGSNVSESRRIVFSREEELAALKSFNCAPKCYYALFAASKDPRLLRECLERHPDDLGANVLLALFHMDQGSLTTAEAAKILSHLREIPGGPAYSCFIEACVAAKAKDGALLHEALDVLARQEPLQNFLADQVSMATRILTEIKGMPAATALSESSRLIPPQTTANLFWLCQAAKQTAGDFTRSQQLAESDGLLASSIVVLSLFPDASVAQWKLRTFFEWDILQRLSPDVLARLPLEPTPQEYVDQAGAERIESNRINDAVLQLAGSSDAAQLAEFISLSAKIGQVEAARQLFAMKGMDDQ